MDSAKKREAIVVDLDGTVALRAERGAFQWELLETDLPNMPIVNLIRMFKEIGFASIMVTGRDERLRIRTCQWLSSHEIDVDELHMRRENDYRQDALIKREIYVDHLEPRFDVKYVLDDRTQVVEMWRSLDLTCLQVAKGDF